MDDLDNGRIAQLVEHTTENRSVGGSIPPSATILRPPQYHRLSRIAGNLGKAVSSTAGSGSQQALILRKLQAPLSREILAKPYPNTAVAGIQLVHP